MKQFTELIVDFTKGMKSLIQALFRNILAFMNMIGDVFRMMFQNILKFLRRMTTFVIKMYHAITDMLVQFIKALWELMIALSILLFFYIPGITGILIDKLVWHHPVLLWAAWGYIALLTAIGIFYRPDGAKLFAQSDSELTNFFASDLLADNHYFQFVKELVERWKELRESIRTEESKPIIEHLESVALDYEEVLTACNAYCKQGIRIRRYMERKDSKKLTEELCKWQLAASATKDKKTRQNYLATIGKLNAELRQLELYKENSERLDSYFIKVSATINHLHSKVLQIGICDSFRKMEENLLKDLEIETQAIDEALQATG